LGDAPFGSEHTFDETAIALEPCSCESLLDVPELLFIVRTLREYTRRGREDTDEEEDEQNVDYRPQHVCSLD
jgi:hypothetical protein